MNKLDLMKGSIRMDKKYCTACKSDSKIVSSNKDGAAIKHKLSCGHSFIELNLFDSVKAREEIKLRKMGETNEEYKRGNKPPNVNYAKKFIEYGDIDFEAATVLFDIQEREYDFMNQAAFLSAQAIEKYLKAFLFWKSSQHYPNLSGKQILVYFKKLKHNLVKILDECVKENKDFNNFRTQIESINRYSLLKYPDVEDEMVYSSEGLSISNEILKDVKQIADFIKALVT